MTPVQIIFFIYAAAIIITLLDIYKVRSAFGNIRLTRETAIYNPDVDKTVI